MEISFRKLALYSMYFYIASLYVLAYDPKLNLISKALFLIVCGWAAFNAIRTRELSKNTGFYIYMISFAAFALLSTLWSPDFNFSIGKALTFCQVLFLSFLIVNMIKTEEEINNMFVAIFWGGMAMCAQAVITYGVSYIFQSLMEGNRLGKEINQANAFGLYTSIMVLIGLYQALYFKKKLYLLLMILPLILAISSGSRKSLFILIVGMGILFATKNGKIKITKILIAIGAIIVVFAILYNIEAIRPVFKRLTTFLKLFDDSSEADTSTLTRLQMIRFGFENFKKSPIIGYGIEGYDILYYRAFGELMPSHCNYIQILNSFGIIGFAMFYGIYFYIIKTAISALKTNRNTAAFIIDIFIVNMVSDIGMTSITQKFPFIYIGIGICFCNIIKAQKKKKLQELKTKT
ncbi:MAG: O-antigen ligase family protein [Bacillota bacterium]|nr:O-antigen ligase family protein [Bacillota bacterium]